MLGPSGGVGEGTWRIAATKKFVRSDRYHQHTLTFTQGTANGVFDVMCKIGELAWDFAASDEGKLLLRKFFAPAQVEVKPSTTLQTISLTFPPSFDASLGGWATPGYQFYIGKRSSKNLQFHSAAMAPQLQQPQPLGLGKRHRAEESSLRVRSRRVGNDDDESEDYADNHHHLLPARATTVDSDDNESLDNRYPKRHRTADSSLPAAGRRAGNNYNDDDKREDYEYVQQGQAKVIPRRRSKKGGITVQRKRSPQDAADSSKGNVYVDNVAASDTEDE